MLAIEKREWERSQFVQKFVDRVGRLEDDHDRRLGLLLAAEILKSLIPQSLERWSGKLDKSDTSEETAEQLWVKLRGSVQVFERVASEEPVLLCMVLDKLLDRGFTGFYDDLMHDEMSPELIPVIFRAPRRDSEVEFVSDHDA